MTVTTALYRRYRPDSFADVIGQEHVTEPLMTALRKNRVNHAYLFSGPRGCGKTTSARILARCLNCAEGPTDTPCGKCPSCVELARGGSGSLDVIEIDAASHGGVDDARDLRERATFAPVRDRYKIFIIDEAHMVTSAGFNALLKIVEEPPEHIKFIFATTEPDKVIGTIRSRTHHYPFRLVPPEPLMNYLELLCRQENVPVAPGVLSLVIRAGGGSVRDTLSVLDQLMAGAGPNGLDYELAVALLGYTHASLLDDVVDAVAAADAATVFRAVDRVIQTGHDPRRFVEDLLERFRDLIIVQAMPESAQAILRGMPEDQIARMRNQATNLGAAELSRAADVTNTALTEMTGATSPRLHLELLCARILLPSSEQTERGIAARIDRVERRLNYAGDAGTPVTAAAAPAAAASSPAAGSSAGAAPAAVAPVRQAAPEPPAATVPPASSVQEQRPAQEQGPVQETATAAASREALTPPRLSTNDWPVEDRPAAQATAPSRQAAPPVAQAESPRAPQPAAAQPAMAQPDVAQPAVAQPAVSKPGIAPGQQPPTAAPTAAPAGGGDVEALRRAWPEILQTLTKIKRSTWALVEPNAQVAQFDGQVLTLAFTTAGLAGAFGRADHSENLRQAIHKTIGIDCQIVAVAGGNSSASSEPNPKAPTSRNAPATPNETSPAEAPQSPNRVSSVDSAWGLAPAVPAHAGSTPASAASQVEPPTAARPAAGVSPHAVAGSADTEQTNRAAPWPADVTASPQAPAPQETAPQAASQSGSSQPGSSATQPAAATPPATGPSAAAAPSADRRAPAGGPLQQENAQAPEPALKSQGDYSYPDDDWGPPLDEDAPPLEEEPPADWEPSPRYPEATQQSRPATGNRAATAYATPAAPSGETPAPEPFQSAGQAPDTSHDPWSRAVEQAPGTWVVGTESNVGKRPADAPSTTDADTTAKADYEPAAAQVPGTAQATGTAPAAIAARNPATTYGRPTSAEQNGSSGWDVAPPSSWPATAPAHGTAPATAPAPSAWPAATAAPEARGSVATLEEGAPSGSPSGRQSLYQRLTNSPEAQMGRVQAPARTPAQPDNTPEDIPSPEDETIEESRVFGRAAVERILGGKLIEERALDGSPLQMR
ncbi:DNA polymerase III subunit gamma and tau [Paenarthrobacter sp. NPDC089322]|uniref:DNA polymerase III subunit gamma and tau n=1 Tax=Paenarthrobacter sp. NPDC089322 TaxID=3155065 RepID=UPI00343F9CCC